MLDLEEFIADYNIKYKKMYKRDKFKYYLYLPHTVLNNIYLEYLEEFGYGENLIELCDPDVAHVSLEHLETVYGYTYYQWEFLKKIEFLDKDSEYDFYLPGEWFNWIDKGNIIFGEIFSLKDYLFKYFKEYAYFYMKDEIPHSVEFKRWEQTATQTYDVLVYSADGKEDELVNWKINLEVFVETEFYTFIEPLLIQSTIFYFKEWPDEATVIISDKEEAEGIYFYNFLESFIIKSKGKLELENYLKSLHGVFNNKLDELRNDNEQEKDKESMQVYSS